MPTPGVPTTAPRPTPSGADANLAEHLRRTSRDPFAARLGLSVPQGWWPSAALLKSYEAAGFTWVQLHAPPASILRDPRAGRRHAVAAAAALETNALSAVIHGPATLRLGLAAGDRAFEGLLSYASECGAEQVVYHALALPDEPGNAAAFAAEERSLARAASLAERLEVTIAIENLAPVFPGPDTASATPLTLRSLARRIGSPRLRLCLDIGHAHVVADGRRTWLDKLCEPVLDLVSLVHVHDNLGARRDRGGAELGVDPLRLDLHLPPGRGSLPWRRIGPLLAAHRAPLVLEVHPPYRPRTSELVHSARRALSRS